MSLKGSGFSVIMMILNVLAIAVPVMPGSAAPGPRTQVSSTRIASLADLVGRKAPDFTLEDVSGRTWRLSELTGRNIVVVQFASTSCGCAQMAVYHLQEMGRTFGARGVQVLAIGFEAQPLRPPAEFIRDSGLTLPFLTDPGLKTAKAYGARWPPSVVVIDRTGTVQWACDEFRGDVFQRTKGVLEPLVAADEAWLADRAYGRLFAAGKRVTVTGVVTRIEHISPQKDISPALMVTLAKGSRRTRVVVAPAWYAEYTGLRIGLKDSLVVSGVSVRTSPEKMVLAGQVRRGKEAFQLKDSSGRFAWAALLQAGKQ